MADPDDGLRRLIETNIEDIRELRRWRHHDATPALASVGALLDALKSLRGRTAELERRLTAIEKSVASMVEADKIAAAVTDAFKDRRGGLLTTWQRWGALAVAVAAIVSAGLQIARALGH